MTESQFQSAVIEYAQLTGWLCHHVRPGRTSRGAYLTHVQGNAGFPDLVLAHKTRPELIFAELKAQKGRLQDNQTEWLRTLDAAGAECYVWRPNDWDFIKTRLQKGGQC